MRLSSVFISILLLGTAIFSVYHIVVLFCNMSNQKNHDEIDSTDSAIFECKQNATENLPCLGLEMVTRHEWVAQPPLNPIGLLDLPATKIILTDTKTEECEYKPKCKNIVRTLQDVHNLYTDDIAYNFLISNQGDIYEGRGWILQSAETSENLTKTSYLLGLIGNFSYSPTNEIQIRAVQKFILHAKTIGKLISAPEILCSENIQIPDTTDITDDEYKKCCKFFN